MAADTWGLSWGGTTGAWLASWARGFVAPQPAPEPTVTPAGSSRKPRRYYVEIDGQRFLADSIEDARAILATAARIAPEAAQTAADEYVARALPRIRSLGRVERPEFGPVIRANVDVSALEAEIQAIYARAAQAAELRLLLERQRAIEDDEDDAAFLLDL